MSDSSPQEPRDRGVEDGSSRPTNVGGGQAGSSGGARDVAPGGRPHPDRPSAANPGAEGDKPSWFYTDDIIIVDDPREPDKGYERTEVEPDEDAEDWPGEAEPDEDEDDRDDEDEDDRDDDEGDDDMPPRPPRLGSGRGSQRRNSRRVVVGDDADWGEADDDDTPARQPLLGGARVGRRRGSRRTIRQEDTGHKRNLTGQERLLALDVWEHCGLPATDFAPLVGVTEHTLYAWRKAFNDRGPAGLTGAKRGPKEGSRLPEPTRRAILLMKEKHPDWGCDRIHDMMSRDDGFRASPGAILRVLKEAGYEVEEAATRPHEPVVRRFERSVPSELWQSDLFTFMLKRQNRRVHMVAFMDDYSRFIVGSGIHASASGSMVREVLEQAIANYGAPHEILTDNGTQYQTWRGKSAFTRLLERRGIKQIVASPRRPQTLGKVERFWGSLWRELVETTIFRDLDDARERIGIWIGWYNFQRCHQALDGLVPADRFFEAAPEVKATLAQRVAANARELAQHGEPRKPFYLTGRVGDATLSLHAEGEKVVLTRDDGSRAEVNLTASGRRDEVTPRSPTVEPGNEQPPAPGTSPLDADLAKLDQALRRDKREEPRP